MPNDTTQTQRDPLIGLSFAGCQIVKKIGAGAMGSVYLGHHPGLDKDMCVKILAPSLAADERNVQFFLREARSAAKLDHKNIVHVFNAGVEHGYHFLTMTYIEGVTLQAIIKEKGRISVDESVKIIIGILEGIKAAHDQSIIHRDIKPSNILVTKDGTPLIVDFGLARKVDEDQQLTMVGEMVGTAYYMSPEQGLGKKVDRRADLYSIGATLFYMLTGKYPFEGKTSMEVIHKHISAEPPSLLRAAPDMPMWLSDIITRLMRKKPEDRFQAAEEVIAALMEKKGGLVMTQISDRKTKALDLNDLTASPALKISQVDRTTREQAAKLSAMVPGLMSDADIMEESLREEEQRKNASLKLDSASVLSPAKPSAPGMSVPTMPTAQGMPTPPASGGELKGGIEFSSSIPEYDSHDVGSRRVYEPVSPVKNAPAGPAAASTEPIITDFTAAVPAKPDREAAKAKVGKTASAKPGFKLKMSDLDPYLEVLFFAVLVVISAVCMVASGAVSAEKISAGTVFFDAIALPWVGGKIPQAQIWVLGTASAVVFITLAASSWRWGVFTLKNIAIAAAALFGYAAGASAYGAEIAARIGTVFTQIKPADFNNFIVYALGSYLLAGYLLATGRNGLSKTAGILAGLLALFFTMQFCAETVSGTLRFDSAYLAAMAVFALGAFLTGFMRKDGKLAVFGPWLFLLAGIVSLWGYQTSPRANYYTSGIERMQEEGIQKAMRKKEYFAAFDPEAAGKVKIPPRRPLGEIRKEARKMAFAYPLERLAASAASAGSYILLSALFALVAVLLCVKENFKREKSWHEEETEFL